MEESKQVTTKTVQLKAVVCQSKVPIRELVSQVANALLSNVDNDTNQVTILGKANTIGKAVSVCEIVKRPF